MDAHPAPAGMGLVTAPVGRCGLCGLEKAGWTGQGIRLYETCYQRESRRAVEAGAEVVAEGQDRGNDVPFQYIWITVSIQNQMFSNALSNILTSQNGLMKKWRCSSLWRKSTPETFLILSSER